jgi:hypothetical protein
MSAIRTPVEGSPPRIHQVLINGLRVNVTKVAGGFTATIVRGQGIDPRRVVEHAQTEAQAIEQAHVALEAANQ